MLGQLKVALLAASSLGALAAVASQTPKRADTKPNFIFIMTDDQDLLLDSLTYQSSVNKLIAQQGTTFEKHYCTVSLCCPSRVSLLTGRASHNTNVTTVSPPFGGYDQFINEGWRDNYLPVWLQNEGYNTYYTGKLMNGYGSKGNSQRDPALGWTDNTLFTDPNTYMYNNVSAQRNSEPIQYHPGNYSTDFVAQRSLEYLDSAISLGEPFFIGVAPIAAHSQSDETTFDPPVPAPRHMGLLPGIQVPRTPSFSPDTPSGSSWIKNIDPRSQIEIDYFDAWYRKRIQTLLAVDEMVESLVSKLDSSPAEVRDNTYIIYTTDNGYHIGQHRLPPGKSCPYEEDVHIPFLIRGPDVAKNATYPYPTSHTDIAPTLFQLAGIPLQEEFDGNPIPVTLTQQKAALSKPRPEHVQIEYWGVGANEGAYPGSTSGKPIIPGTGAGGIIIGPVAFPNTWKAMRVIGQEYDISYIVWCNGNHELYDMREDPHQMNNFYSGRSDSELDEEATINGWPLRLLQPRVDALLLQTKACKGKACREPWLAIHPRGNVNSLADAMDPRFDEFYVDTQPKVDFQACRFGYFPESELPLYAEVYNGAY